MSSTTRTSPTELSMEERIAQLWAKILKVSDVKGDESFFELGGDSMLMMQLIARIQEEFGIEVKHDIIFQGPTLHEFTRAVLAATTADLQSAEFDDGAL